MPKEPIAQNCSNSGVSDHWTCPGCYKDLNDVQPGSTVICDKCGNAVECTLRHEPTCHSRIVPVEAD